MFGVIGLLGGILLIFLGGFLVFFFPSEGRHQQQSLSMGGIIIGFIFLLFGFILVIF